MIEIRFELVNDALDHAKKHGGWIFVSNDFETVRWYDAWKFSITDILRITNGSGYVGSWTEVEKWVLTS